MFSGNTDMPHLLFQALAGLILIVGATADLYLGMLLQTRRLKAALPSLPVLTGRPFTLFHAQLAVFATLMFALPSLSQKPDAQVPPQLSLILGPLFYACAGALVVFLCLTYSRATVRQAFFSPSCTTRRALARGLFYGLAAIPPVVLLSMLMTTLTEKLGYKPQLQEVFDWLGDGSLAVGTRVFMMFAAIVIAPVVEETLFRGILFPPVLKTRPFLFAALLTGAYFALVHFHAPSFLPLLALSVAFSAGYASTGSILTPIVMHAVFNLTSLVFYLADTL